MNFNFINTQRRFGNQPNMRQFSTIGVLPPKIDSLLTKNDQINFFNGPIISNKSFTNPNFVNKHHPNVLSSSLAGIVNFDKQTVNIDKQNINFEKQNVGFDKQNLCVQPKCDIKYEEKTSNCVIPEKSSQENIVNTLPLDQRKIQSPKMTKRNKRKKNRPKKKDKKCKNNKKSRPWHKTNMDYEIMELSESTLDSDSSNMIDEPEPMCITIIKPIQSKPIDKKNCITSKLSPNGKCSTTKSNPIDIISNPRLQIDKSDSSMSISPCHHEILKSLSLSKSDSPCSPIIRRLRMPSECESEDSFVIFDHGDETSSEDSDFEEESEMSCDSDSDVEFSEHCDSIQKKVCNT